MNDIFCRSRDCSHQSLFFDDEKGPLCGICYHQLQWERRNVIFEELKNKWAQDILKEN